MIESILRAIKSIEDRLGRLESRSRGGRWMDWTPTFGGTGSMTYTSVTAQARYCQIGKTVFFVIYASGTTGGTASWGLTVTLPVTAAAGFSGNSGNGYAEGVAGYWYMSGATQVTALRYDGSNYGLGAAKVLAISGHYEAA